MKHWDDMSIEEKYAESVLQRLKYAHEVFDLYRIGTLTKRQVVRMLNNVKKRDKYEMSFWRFDIDQEGQSFWDDVEWGIDKIISQVKQN